MIRVRRIAHASLETPDIERQVAYYTQILGLTLVARDDEAAYLASTLDHHSVVLRHGSEPRCTRIAFQLAPDADLDGFERQVAEQGIRTTRKSDPEPSIPALISFTDPKGTVMEVFREREFAGQRYQSKGIVPHRLGHVAFHVEDVQKAARCSDSVTRTGWRTFSHSCAAGPTITPSIWSRPARSNCTTLPSRCATGRT